MKQTPISAFSAPLRCMIRNLRTPHKFSCMAILMRAIVSIALAAKLTTAGGSQTQVIQIIGWATGWLSAFLDNVLG